METNNERYGKKTDQETQSPILKVFKDMMQREKNVPEKANLLKEKLDNRKRRQYSGSRSKSERTRKSIESSSSEKQRRSVQYKVGGGGHGQKVEDYHQRRTSSTPFQDEKRESWWLFKSDSANKKKSEDTSSCVSCALKRIISSEYTCIACLGVIFLLTVLGAFVMLFRTAPIEPKVKPIRKPLVVDNRLGDDMLKRGRRRWDDIMSRHVSDLSSVHGNDFDANYRDGTVFENSGLSSDSELSGILNADSLNYGSEQLRNFYKKLIETDTQIRNLKKSFRDQKFFTNIGSKYDRMKRSLIKNPMHLIHFGKKVKANVDTTKNLTKNQDLKTHNPQNKGNNVTKKISDKVKRFINSTDEPTGFIIEKKQVIVEYKPKDTLRKVPKCSHVPKESKSHEKQMKHPFYKNTQRLDELLDKFLDRNIPNMMVDPFGVDVLFKNKDKYKTHSTKAVVDTELETRRPVTQIKNIKVTKERNTKLNKEFIDFVPNKNRNDAKYTTSSPNSAYDVLLSISTIVNPGVQKISKSVSTGVGRSTPSLLERVPHIRKLMQVEENDQELGYDDAQEVLANEGETRDESDKILDKEKRLTLTVMNNPQEAKIASNPSKFNTPGLYNPNWKGPMPLYPDELNSMIQQAAMQNINKIEVPINTKDTSSESDSEEKDINDVEYVENYSDNKYNKLVKMAQAYSDYGVLDEKKGSDNGNKGIDDKETFRRVKLSVNKGRSLKDIFLNRLKKEKCEVSDGIRFELKPTTSAREDGGGIEIMKALQKHVKVTKDGKGLLSHIIPAQVHTNTEYALFGPAIVKTVTTQRDNEAPKQTDTNIPDSGIIFSFNKGGKRKIKYSADKDIAIDDGKETPKTSETSKLDDANKYDEDNDKLLRVNYNKQEEMSGSVVDIENLNTGIVKNEEGLRIKKRSLKSVEIVDNDISQISVKDGQNSFYGLDWNNNIIDNVVTVKIDTDTTEINRGISAKHDTKINENPNNTGNAANEQKIGILTNITEDNGSEDLFKLNWNNISGKGLNYFSMMTDWFSSFSSKYRLSSRNKEMFNITNYTTDVISKSASRCNVSLNTEYPSDDQHLWENITRKSRVLLSLEDTTDDTSTDIIVTGTTRKIKDKEDISTNFSVTENTITTSVSVTPISTEKKGLNTYPTNENITTLFLNNTIADNRAKRENKTIVKRNIEDTNSIFWNDMYDDEYGVKIDPIENIRDKQNIRGLEFVKRSGNWIHDKFRNFANNFKQVRDESDIKGVKKRPRSAKYVTINPYSRKTPNRYHKRAAKCTSVVYEEKDENPNSFSALTAKMKEVCKEAAKAVQQTKNIKVRREEKEDSMTSTLMQQLVKLMTDLVDFQVQQKTCVRLPPDLQEFLEWLTAPNPEDIEFKNNRVGYNEDYTMDKSTEPILELIPSSSEKDVHADSRSDCLGTLTAVQDLMKQLDDMTDEDKSKMTGVREYLENQLDFLQRQLTAFDESRINKAPAMFEEQTPYFRFRRNVKTAKQQETNDNQIEKSKIRCRRRFLKNYGKKHTRTTASINDGYQTDMFTFEDGNGRSNDVIVNVEREKQIKIDKRDISIEEEKSTSKYQKEFAKGFDNAQVVRI